MLLNIHDIPVDGLDVVCVRDLDWMRSHGVTEHEVAVLDRPLRAALRFMPAGQIILVTGRVLADAAAPCVRCNAPVSHKLDISVDLHLRPIREVEIGSESIELSPDELEQDFYDGQTIDVEGLVAQEILLHVEAYPRCREACRPMPEAGTSEPPGQTRDPASLAAQLAALRKSTQEVQ